MLTYCYRCSVVFLLSLSVVWLIHVNYKVFVVEPADLNSVMSLYLATVCVLQPGWSNHGGKSWHGAVHRQHLPRTERSGHWWLCECSCVDFCLAIALWCTLNFSGKFSSHWPCYPTLPELWAAELFSLQAVALDVLIIVWSVCLLGTRVTCAKMA